MTRGSVLVAMVAFVAFYLALNSAYLGGAAGAWRDLRRLGREVKRSTLAETFASPLTPGVSLLVPAHNERAAIVDTVYSLLGLRYPRTEIIVVDNGSTDGTLDRLREEFDLVPAVRALRDTVPVRPVDSSLVSTRHPHLWVLHKRAGGKADALNTGLVAAGHPYVAAIDGDGLLEEDALLAAVRPMLDDPDVVIATGGMLRVANGCEVDRGRITRVRMPRRTVPNIQIVEYLRSFLIMRVFFTGVNSLLIISGAFGVFRRDLAERVGGWWTETAADDVEIVIHLHRHLREEGRPYRVALLPDAVCWTEVPETMRDLLRQRRRWHRGLAESTWRHRAVIGRPRYRRLGLYSVPYVLLELAGPVVELVAYGFVVAGAALGVLSIPLFVAFLAVSFLTNMLVSLAALALAEVDYHRRPDRREARRLLWCAVLENLGYRQLVSLWCLFGVVDFLRGRRRYVQPTRHGFVSGSPDAVPATPSNRI